MFHVTPKAKIRRARVAAAALTVTAGVVFFTSAMPSSASTDTYVERQAAAEQRIEDLEVQRLRYTTANVSIDDLQSPVPSLSSTSGSVKSDVKLAVFEALTGMGMTPPEGLSVVESARSASQLVGFSTEVDMPGGFSEVDMLLDHLDGKGYLVTINSLNVDADTIEDIRDTGVDHTVRAGLVFWFLDD